VSGRRHEFGAGCRVAPRSASRRRARCLRAARRAR